MSYYESLPASFGSQVFETGTDVSLKSFDFAASYDPTKFAGELGVDSGALDLPGLSGQGALSTGAGWTFITAPENVEWDIANQANRVDIFGTNNPPVVAGSRGMRDLSLSNALVEGFVRNVSVEAKVGALESLMNYGLNSSDGFVSVPVYQVWANSKSYGGPEAYYIIKDVKVKETMRDIQGNSTRAYVDVSLMQVPAYQVNSGRDQASQKTAAAGSVLQADNKAIQQQANQAVQGAAGKGGTPAAAPGAKPSSGPAVGAAAPAKPAAAGGAAAAATPQVRPIPVVPGTEIRLF